MKKDLSIKFTRIATRAAIVLSAVSLFVMPWAAKFYAWNVSIYGDDDIYVPLLITFYICAAAGFCILFILDRLVGNISKGDVFTDENVKFLRRLSYLCLFIALVALIFSYFRFLSLIITFSALFFALLLRVIKNCFEEAVRLKEENDYTI
ncbi:MAG: DUF2975 domain-containing protein [Oscillospiraceae bacterium]|nr:DUF2975 domain-containing protein [Oscillospiraceae bacterium]